MGVSPAFLFERTTRSMTLTDDGRRLYEQIVPLLAGLEEVAGSVTEGRTLVQGRLRVNVHPFFSRLILGPRLGSFLEKHSKLKVEIHSRDALGDLIADGFDLAIRFGDPQPSSLVARRLLDTRILTVAAPSYLKRYGQPTSPEELISTSHRLIDFVDPESGRPFKWEFHRGRKRIEVPTSGQLIVNDVATMHGVCLAGYGIAQVMELGAEKLVSEGRLVRLFPDWSDERFPLYVLYPSRAHPPAKTRAFLEFVSSIAK